MILLDLGARYSLQHFPNTATCWDWGQSSDWKITYLSCKFIRPAVRLRVLDFGGKSCFPLPLYSQSVHTSKVRVREIEVLQLLARSAGCFLSTSPHCSTPQAFQSRAWIKKGETHQPRYIRYTRKVVMAAGYHNCVKLLDCVRVRAQSTTITWLTSTLLIFFSLPLLSCLNSIDSKRHMVPVFHNFETLVLNRITLWRESRIGTCWI